MSENKRPLYIPIKTLDADDYIEGIGRLEVALIGGGVALGLVLGIFVANIIRNSLAGVVIGIVITILSIGVFRRDSANENLIQKFRIIYQFIYAQKRYMYQYYEILETMDISENEEGTLSE